MSEEPVNPKPPIGRFGEISDGKLLHIVNRHGAFILCDHNVLSLPGFPVGQEYGMTRYCKVCVHRLLELTS